MIKLLGYRLSLEDNPDLNGSYHKQCFINSRAYQSVINNYDQENIFSYDIQSSDKCTWCHDAVCYEPRYDDYLEVA